MRRFFRHIAAVSIGAALYAHEAAAQVSIEVPVNFAGFSSQPLPVILGNLIGVFLGFMGLFLILIIFAGGMMWMTSGGNEDRISGAKKLMGAGVIGLILILMSYSIAGFLVSSLAQAV